MNTSMMFGFVGGGGGGWLSEIFSISENTMLKLMKVQTPNALAFL